MNTYFVYGDLKDIESENFLMSYTAQDDKAAKQKFYSAGYNNLGASLLDEDYNVLIKG